MMQWLQYAWPRVFQLLAEHLILTVPAVLLSILIAVPLGLLAARRPRAGGAVLSVSTLLYCIPALPLVVILPTLIGIPLRSRTTIILALCVYGTALLVRTASDAFRSVPADARVAALAVGTSPRQLFWRVDLPLAVPVLISGIRVITVSTVSLVTIGALVGVPSLGSLFTDGFQRGIVVEVLVGIVTVVLLALVLDGLCQLTGKALAPWQGRLR